MPVIPDKQIAASATVAGFKGKDLEIAVAVALAESSGNTEASNNYGAGHRGLWQISRLHKILADGDWKNPDWNAHCAYQVWKGQGWNAWQAYTNKAYMMYMPRAKIATNNGSGVYRSNIPIDPIGVAQGIGGLLYPITSTASGVEAFWTMINDPKMWLRVAMFLVGGILLFFGAMKMNPVDNAVRSVGKAVGKAIL